MCAAAGARAPHAAGRAAHPGGARHLYGELAEGGAANYNVRVALEEVDDVFGGDDDDDELEGMEPGVLGREEMKKSAATMLDKATSKKGKKKKAGKFAGDKNAAPGAKPGLS